MDTAAGWEGELVDMNNPSLTRVGIAVVMEAGSPRLQ